MINKAILLGNLCADPEVKPLPSGITVANMRLATNSRRKVGDQWEDVAEFHNVVAFGKTAENIGKYCGKGKQLFIEGRIQTRKWQDKDGRDRYSTEIVADQVRFLGGAEQRQERPAAPVPNNGGQQRPADDIPF
jgi:single-strand DNA-binding protein